MAKFNTKVFGEIVTGEEIDDWGLIDVNINGQELYIGLLDTYTYEKLSGDKLTKALEFVDQYLEINAIAKNAIVENFDTDDTVNDYFEYHFEDVLDDDVLKEIFGTESFEELDIKKVVENMAYPNLTFWIDDDELMISLDYRVSKEYSDAILCIEMDEDFEVIGFEHES